MTKYILLVILAVFYSCEEKNLKKELDALNIIQEKNKEVLKKKEIKIQELSTILEGNLKELKKVDKKLEDIREEYLIKRAIDASEESRQFSDVYYTLNYEALPSDNYWSRGVYYTSNIEKELLYNPKAVVYNNQVYFYFIGVQFIGEKDIKITVYELDEGKNIHAIDVLNSDLKMDIKWGISLNYDESYNLALPSFIASQIDNLIIKDGVLYYYKIEGYEYLDYGLRTEKKQFYSYSIGARENPKRINKNVLSYVMGDESDYTKIISPDKSKLIVSSPDSLSFYKLEKVSYNTIYLDYYLPEGLSEIKFPLKKKKTKYKDLSIQEIKEGVILTRKVTWHTTDNKVYYNNQRLIENGVLELDVDTKKSTKIIPETNVMHPYFFKIGDKEYITYVQGNQIMLSEAPVE